MSETQNSQMLISGIEIMSFISNLVPRKIFLSAANIVILKFTLKSYVNILGNTQYLGNICVFCHYYDLVREKRLLEHIQVFQ